MQRQLLSIIILYDLRLSVSMFLDLTRLLFIDVLVEAEFIELSL